MYVSAETRRFITEIVNKYPLLTKEEEQELYVNKTRREFEDLLVLHNLRYAVSMARKYNIATMDFEDKIGVAITGLVRAARIFDVGKNVKFVTHATKVIQTEFRNIWALVEYKNVAARTRTLSSFVKHATLKDSEQEIPSDLVVYGAMKLNGVADKSERSVYDDGNDLFREAYEIIRKHKIYDKDGSVLYRSKKRSEMMITAVRMFCNGCSYEDISREMNISFNQVKFLIQNAWQEIGGNRNFCEINGIKFDNMRRLLGFKMRSAFDEMRSRQLGRGYKTFNYDRIAMFKSKKADGCIVRKYSSPERGNFYTSDAYKRMSAVYR